MSLIVKPRNAASVGETILAKSSEPDPTDLIQVTLEGEILFEGPPPISWLIPPSCAGKEIVVKLIVGGGLADSHGITVRP